VGVIGLISAKVKTACILTICTSTTASTGAGAGSGIGLVGLADFPAAC
jgi:hypothetical protein